jgi:hypothetical protein
MGFVSILKKVGLVAGEAAPQIISSFNPALGAITGSVLQSVLLTEAQMGAGNGDAKKQASMNALQIALPLLLELVATTTNRQLADPNALAGGFEKLNDGVVDILNAFRVLPKN